jgi:predicted DsbA family dithiol-disulfide isomerase
MNEVARNPLRPGKPVGFCVLRVPFFLEPDYPTDEKFEETNRTRLIRKWGGPAEWERQKARHGLKERGREVGIEHFNLDRIASSTLASHRLVQWMTKTHGIAASEALYANLNFRHFEKGEKLNSSRLLVEAAAKAGADPAEAEAFLASDKGVAEIRKAQQILAGMGVHSIPTFVLGGKRVVSGAAHSNEIMRHLRALEEQGDADSSVFADALGIPPQVLEQTLPLKAATA